MPRLRDAFVDPDRPHLLLRYGPGDDPSSWVNVARIAPLSDGAPGAELLIDDPRLALEATRFVETQMNDPFRTVVMVHPGEMCWWRTLVMRTGTFANWYGDWHWALIGGSR